MLLDSALAAAETNIYRWLLAPSHKNLCMLIAVSPHTAADGHAGVSVLTGAGWDNHNHTPLN
jgi:hypothetical protein